MNVYFGGGGGIWWHKDGFVLCLRNITTAGYVYYAVVEKIFLG